MKKFFDGDLEMGKNLHLQNGTSVWICFETNRTVLKIGIMGGSTNHAVESFRVHGDKKLLLTVDDAGFQANNEERSWLIPVEKRGPHKCYGLEAIQGGGGGNRKVKIKEILMWESLN